MIPSIYINLEDDASKIITRLKKEKASEAVLVCPKRCFLFNDSINLKLLKKQVDVLGKKVFILTMDERGQQYAKEAGFELKSLPKAGGARGFSDIARKNKTASEPSPVKIKEEGALVSALSSIKHFAEAGLAKPAPQIKTAHSKPEILAAPIEEANREAEILSAPVVPQSGNFFPAELHATYKDQQKKRRGSRLITVFLLFALVVAAAVVFVVLPKAEIVLYPKTQGLTRDLVVSATLSATESNVEGLIIPAVKVNQTVNTSANFQSQGKREVGNKASGSVVIYNFTGAPINLKAKTTTLVLNGKNYALKEDALQVKPTRYKNSKTKEIDPASLGTPLDVEAAEGGEGYNVPAGTRLEVNNQVFGLRPQLLYAKASSAITGGTSRYLSFITQDDLNQAKAVLQKQALTQLAQVLASQNLALPDQAAQLQSPQATFDRSVGTESPNFSGQLSAQAIGLTYNKNTLQDLVLKRIRQSLAASGDIDIRLSQPLNVKVKSYDPSTGLMVVDVHFEGEAVAKISNINAVSVVLLGKKQTTAAEYLKTHLEISRVEITIVPGWQSWLPWLKNNIILKIAE